MNHFLEKLTIVIIFMSSNCFAFKNPVRVVEAEKIILGGVGKTHDCSISEPDCMDYSHIGWDAAKIIDGFTEEPVFEFNSQSACETPSDCENKLALLVCDEGWTAAWKEDPLHVYCYRQSGVREVLTGRKVLVEDPVKKQEKEALALQESQRLEQLRIEKEEARLNIIAIDWENITTIDHIKSILKDLIEKTGEIE